MGAKVDWTAVAISLQLQLGEFWPRRLFCSILV